MQDAKIKYSVVSWKTIIKKMDFVIYICLDPNIKLFNKEIHYEKVLILTNIFYK